MLNPIVAPGPSSTPYPVNNVPGESSGTITASGQIVGTSKTPIFLKVVRGNPYTPGTIPARPLMGCTRISATGGGGWTCGNLAGASCSPSSPFPQNQLLVWVYANSTYHATLCSFTGISMN